MIFLFAGEFKYWYWNLKNKFLGELEGGCYCTMREECRNCWTYWEKELSEKKRNKK